MENLLAQYAGLVGVAALIALMINVLKTFEIVTDGTAQNWSAGLNLVFLTGLLVLQIWAPQVDVAELDAKIAGLVQVGVVVLGYVLQLLGSKVTHQIVKGTALIGTSNSK